MLDAQRTGIGGLAKLGEGVRANSDAKTQAGLTRGPSLGKKLINAAWTDTFPAQGATLDLDFANDRGFVRGLGQGKSMDAVTFTRASKGGFINQNGLLRGMVLNLLRATEDTTDSVWVKTLATVTETSAEAPNGELSADICVYENDGRIQQLGTVISANSTVVFSCYIKGTAGETVNLYMNINVGGATWSGVSSGAVTSAAVVYKIFTLTGGWDRFELTGTTSTNTSNFLIAINDTRAGTGNPTARTITIWGAQLELGSSATEYFPTNIGQPRFDWASTAVVAQRNLATNTENLAAFSFQRSIITTNIIANPLDGEITADKWADDSVNTGEHVINNWFNFSSGGTYTFSIYAKEEGRKLQLDSFISGIGIVGGLFDLVNGTATSVNGATTSIISIGLSGWYRCSMTFTYASSGTVNARLVTNAGSASYLGDGVSGVYAFGWQLELGDTATDYQPIAQPTSSTPLAANPTSNGLLIEEARTNRILWCRDATQTQWVKTNVTAAKDQTGVDGVANAASSLTATANDGTCIQTITLASGSRTGSVYLKRITGTGNVQVSLDGTTYSTVDLSDTEWRRIVLSGTVTNPTVGIKLAVSGDAVAMDYGQVEDGLFATTPILTTTATATRSADVATMEGINLINWYKFSNGVFSTESALPVTGGAIFTLLGASNNYLYVDRLTSTLLRAFVNATGVGGTTSVTIEPNISLCKVSTRILNGNNAISVNNYDIRIFGGILNPVQTSLRLGQAFNQATTFNSTLKRITYTPQVLSDNALKNITTIV